MKNKSIDIYRCHILTQKIKTRSESDARFDGISRASYFRSLEKALRNLSIHDAADKKKVFV